MPHKGYKQSKSHKKLLSIRAVQRGKWKKRPDAVAKMRGPKSEAHRAKLSVAALRRWARGRPQWYVAPKPKEPVEPVAPMYRDIYMDNVTVDVDGTVWYDCN